MHTKKTVALLVSAFLLASTSHSMAQGRSDERGAQGRMNPAQVEQMTQGWPESSRKAIEFMTDTYGPPAAVTADSAIWGETGPWKRTVVYRNEVQHDFPMPHPDVLQQWVDFEAPLDKYDELAQFDGSVVVERTTGEASARCDKEAANFLALNLAHDVAMDGRSVEEARMEYGRQIKAMKANQPAPLTERLTFDMNNTKDPGEALPGM
ncbi:hypothetical protein [Lysobacter sp. D1-1-M9]|uniref:hypothetical protein n=1 Tax=Novilysobacter longmucuonensis TaxID=3098603 RepID=UPI002FC91B21